MPDAWLDPCRVANRRLLFEHSVAEVRAADASFGPFNTGDSGSLARDIVRRVRERMRVSPTAFGIGAPKSLAEIVSKARGNCVSHAVLATVLLRYHGIAARLMAEEVFTSFSLLRTPAALLIAPIGPTLNGHVWLEATIDERWQPADPELGIFGAEEWVHARLTGGVTLRALGMPVSEHWRFPLRIRCLREDGAPDGDATQLYLIDHASETLGCDPPAAWAEGVQFFASSFRWQGRAGLRIAGETRRLRSMSRALSEWVRRRRP
jgi:hypothetical protein